MKRLISKFSDRLLNNQQLKAVKGGTPYCFCNNSPVDCGPGVSGGSQWCPGDPPGNGGGPICYGLQVPYHCP